MIDRADRRILLTGATGYVGGELLRQLEQSRGPLRCLTRRPQLLRDRVGAQTEIVAGDVLERDTLDAALRDVHTAYYLVHSMGAAGDFEVTDRLAASNFAAAAAAAGVSQIVYLGGLGGGRELSRHLASRQEVGQLLRACGVPTLELRAAVVIGPGSASFETVRSLVEHLPVIVAPTCVETLSQPIAVSDVVASLLAAVELESPLDAVCEIGGADQVSYAELLREYARQRGLHRRVLPLPLLTPHVCASVLGLLRSRYAQVGAAMLDGLRNETVVTSAPATPLFGDGTRHGLADAIARALCEEDRAFAERHWSRELPGRGSRRWGGFAFGCRRVTSRTVRVGRAPSEAFAPIQRIGGSTGWYAGDWFWRLRALLDRLGGGQGMRRGRRDAVDLRVGDSVDFWRVERFESGRRLLLAAEMRLPGRLWLQFEVEAAGAGTTLRQTTIFDPHGFAGRIYWYLLYPVHRAVFARMLAGIRRASGPDAGPLGHGSQPLLGSRG